MNDDFILSSRLYKELLQSLKDCEAYGKKADKSCERLRAALKPCVLFLEDYLRHTTHPGVSRLVSDAKELL